MREKPAFSLPGGAMLLLLLVAIGGTGFVLISSFQMQSLSAILVAAFALLVEIVCLSGLLIVNPNEGQVLQLFGTYVGTLRDQGFRWVNPFTTKRKISLRIRNFKTDKLKVNDLDGNPIEIAAVVVWQVVDTAEAVFQVDSYENCASAERERVAHDGDFVRLRFARRRPNELAKPHRGDCSGTTKGNPGALGESRSAGGGSAHQPSGIRRGNCRSDAAAATSVGNHRGEADDPRGRREHRADGARPTVGTKGGGTRSGTPCGDGEQFIGRVVRRAQPAAGGQRWDALQLGARWGSANHFFCASIVRRTTLWKGGPRMNCAA